MDVLELLRLLRAGLDRLADRAIVLTITGASYRLSRKEGTPTTTSLPAGGASMSSAAWCTFAAKSWYSLAEDDRCSCGRKVTGRNERRRPDRRLPPPANARPGRSSPEE